MSCFRKLLKIKWQDKVLELDTLVLARAGVTSIHTIICSARLRWAGHVAHRSDEHLKKVFYGELKLGKHPCGGQNFFLHGLLKKLPKRVLHWSSNWESFASNPSTQHSSGQAGAGVVEDNQLSKTFEKQAEQKASVSASTAVLVPV